MKFASQFVFLLGFEAQVVSQYLLLRDSRCQLPLRYNGTITMLSRLIINCGSSFVVRVERIP